MSCDFMEIGSEFWLEYTELNKKRDKIFNFGKDTNFFISGRVAIDYVIKEIMLQKNVKSVYFPSYCCESMIKPFINNNIEVKFYNVNFEKNIIYEIDKNCECDIFFAMSYFGYSSTRMDEYIDVFKNRGVVVIEDITHSLLSDCPFSSKSDYLIGSLRKWFPIISGAIAVNMIDKFTNKSLKEFQLEYVVLRKEAMLLKKAYIDGEVIEKEKFLIKYKESNKILDNYKSNYGIDEESLQILHSLDFDKIKKVRKENSKIIYGNLNHIKEISFLIPHFKEGDCPLFVPIVFQDKEKRDELKQFLINKGVYCPAHWPKVDFVKNSNIYDRELSLICDQRYTKKDIENYINEFRKENKNMDDIYFNKNYGKLYEKVEKGINTVFEINTDDGKIVNQFIKRKIPIEIDNNEYYDIITPYGYGGPVIEYCNGNKSKLLQEYQEKFEIYCRENNIVSEFVRFHPIANNALDFKKIYNVKNVRKTLGTNLSISDEPMIDEFSKSCRKTIRQVLKKGVSYKIIEDVKDFSEFKRIYFLNMDRKNADEYYYFDDEYFSLMDKYFHNNLMQVQAIYEDKVIAEGLYFKYNKTIHAHLSGTDSEFLYLSPAYILKYATVVWGKENGFEMIHYGGGSTNSEDDPLFLFKKKFSQNTEFDFYIGKKIWNEDIYDRICKEKNVEKDEKFFPAYRKK